MSRINRNILATAFPDQPRMVKAFEDLDKALDDAALRVVDLQGAIDAAVAEAGDIPARLAEKQAAHPLLTALANMTPGAGVIEMAGANQFAIREVQTADGSSLVTLDQLSAVSGAGYTVTNKAASYTETATSGERIILCSGSFTITLPTAVGNTAKLQIKLVTAGSITVDGAGAETIDGGATFALTVQWQAITLISDGAQWLII